MKNPFRLLAVVAVSSTLMLSLTACSESSPSADTDNPASVANAYMEAVQAQDYEQVEGLLTAETAAEFVAPPQSIIDQITPVQNATVEDFTVEEGATSVDPEVSYDFADGTATGTSISLIKDESAGWQVDTLLTDFVLPRDVLGVQGIIFDDEDISEYTLLPGTTEAVYSSNDIFEEYTFEGNPTDENLREGITFRTDLEDTYRPDVEDAIREGVLQAYIDGEVCDMNGDCADIINKMPTGYTFEADAVDGVKFTFDDLTLTTTDGVELTATPAMSGEVKLDLITKELSYLMSAG